MKETLQAKIARVTSEDISLENYNPDWEKMFEEEKKHLMDCIPNNLIRRIEHFGSTAIPGMPAKPIIDMLVEVTSLDEAKIVFPPILESQGYDYFWKPTTGDDTPPFYSWFIKRNKKGKRTHHIHMIEKDFEHWDRLYFRDYLIEYPEIAKEYAELKLKLSKEFTNNRIAYTDAKTEFISRITLAAKKLYNVPK